MLFGYIINFNEMSQVWQEPAEAGGCPVKNSALCTLNALNLALHEKSPLIM